MIIKKCLLASFVAFIFTITGCKSLKEPENVSQPLDYTNDDVITNEINNIYSIIEKTPVKALWRALYLNDEKVINECSEIVKNLLVKAIEEKNYFDAVRYHKSLVTAGYNFEDDLLIQKIEEINSDYNIPGYTVDEEKLPKTITDCINATVTVWVDKGFKIQNGTGYADVVIGSGFFIDKRGYLITNHHVIKDIVDSKYEGYSRCYVKLPADMDTKIPAKVIGYDSTIDLALLKVEMEPQFVFELGSSEDLSVGDKISAIGTPIGLEGTLTSGIISSVERKLNMMGNVFQIDAAVNSGNSGGPIIDENKKVQAIVFAGMLQFQGLNFAIPVEYLRQLLPILYNGGAVNHPWISAYGHTKKIKTVKQGLEVQYVLPGDSAAFSGLREGDIIISADGKDVNSIDDFQYILMGYEPGTIINCTYKNNEDEIKTIPVYLDFRPEYPVEKFFNSDLIADSFIPIFGMKLSRSSTINRKSYTIVKVFNGTLADEMGFSENDPVTIQAMKFDYENNCFLAQLLVQRHKRGYIDVSLTVGASLDSPYYF